MAQAPIFAAAPGKANVRSFTIALMFLTRLPVRLQGDLTMADVGRAAPYYPLVGLLVGGLAALVIGLGDIIGLPPIPAIFLAMAVTLLLTGALHEDGLADAVDALGSADPAKRLEIMRDSRLGTFGALALIIAIGSKVALLAALPSANACMIALAVMHCWSRALMSLPMAFLAPARQDGLGQASAGLSKPACAMAHLGAGLACTLLLGWPGLLVLLSALTIAAGFVFWQNRAFGGYSGDTIGATQQIGEIAVLLSLAIWVH